MSAKAADQVFLTCDHHLFCSTPSAFDGKFRLLPIITFHIISSSSVLPIDSIGNP